MVAQVRRFNRLYTQRVGALETRYLARDRPLGEARVLWEIGDDGRDVKELRQQLDLDSGYLSRLLRSLEAAGLVTVGPSAADRQRAHRSPDGGGSGRAGGARPAQRRAGGLGPRTAVVAPARAARPGAGRGRAPAGGRARQPSTWSTPACRRRSRACRPTTDELDRRFATGFDPAQPAGRDGRDAGAGRRVPRRHPAGRARGVRRPQVPPRRGGRAEAPVGRRLGPGTRGRAAAAGPAGGARGGATARRGPARDERLAHRGDRPLRERRVPRGPGVQRRGLRRPLVREAPGRLPRDRSLRDRSRGESRSRASDRARGGRATACGRREAVERREHGGLDPARRPPRGR